MQKVLFLDDTPFFHKQFKDILNKIGNFEITGFENGIDLIEKYKGLNQAKENVDIIFIDFILYDMTCFAVLEEIMKINKNAFVIIMGGGHKEDIIKGIKLGAKWFIRKPFDEENIRNALMRFNIIKK